MAKVIAGIISPDEELVLLNVGRRNLTLTYGDVTFIFRMVEGFYPNYRAVIPTMNDKELIVATKDLQGAIKRTSVFSNKSGLITFDIVQDSLVVGGKDLDFKLSAQEKINAECGTTLFIGFQNDLMLQCLSAVNNDQTRITMKEANTACLVSPIHQDDQTTLTILIMPMMINA